MATTGIGSGLCEGNVLAMAIEGPGEQIEGGRALRQVGQDKEARRPAELGDILGYADRVTITIQQTVITSRYQCPSLVLLRYIHCLISSPTDSEKGHMCHFLQ